MLESIVKFLLWCVFEFVGWAITLISPVRLTRKVLYDVPLSEEPDGFFVKLALWSSDCIFLILVVFGVVMLFRSTWRLFAGS